MCFPLRSNFNTREFLSREHLDLLSQLGTLWEFHDHVKTQASYHQPGPPYTYQGPEFKR